VTIIGTLAFVLSILASRDFRRWYRESLPKLFGAWKVTMAVLLFSWALTTLCVGVVSPRILKGQLYYAFAAGTLLGFTELIFISGPGFVSMFRALKNRGNLLLGFGAAVMGLIFAVSTTWVLRMPDLKGAQFSVQDMAVRAVAIVSGVLMVAALIGRFIPPLLNLLERRTFPWFVGARHIRAEKSGFLTVISILSIMGVSVSSCALSSVTSVMGGFSQDLKRKILGNNAHIVVDTESRAPFENYDDVLARLRKDARVVGATPVVHGECMISSNSNLAGVIVRGVEPSSIRHVIELETNIEVGKFDYLTDPARLLDLPKDEIIGLGPHGEPYKKGGSVSLIDDGFEVPQGRVKPPVRPGLIVGRELAKTIHVLVGDEVTLVSPLGDLGPMGMMPRTRKFRVAAIFYSGMYEYDATHVYTTLEVAQDYFQLQKKVSVIDVKVKSAEQVEQDTDAVRNIVARSDLRVRDWREINKNLFSALKLERFATFVILSIAIAVASFCIICTLLLMVTEKGKEIAILKALGASDGQILRTFMVEGVLIGAIGTIFGVTGALGLCSGVKVFGLRLDPDVYYIDRLPINVSGWDFLTVALASLTICTISTIYPAVAASRLRPVEGLRYE
jgi:lipoprotein-releasing system permease protein